VTAVRERRGTAMAAVRERRCAGNTAGMYALFRSIAASTGPG
jgi:hypothetical protein